MGLFDRICKMPECARRVVYGNENQWIGIFQHPIFENPMLCWLRKNCAVTQPINSACRPFTLGVLSMEEESTLIIAVYTASGLLAVFYTPTEVIEAAEKSPSVGLVSAGFDEVDSVHVGGSSRYTTVKLNEFGGDEGDLAEETNQEKQ